MSECATDRRERDDSVHLETILGRIWICSETTMAINPVYLAVTCFLLQLMHVNAIPGGFDSALSCFFNAVLAALGLKTMQMDGNIT